MSSTEEVGENADNRDERETSPKAEEQEPVLSAATAKVVTDDEDSEWEDLDEVLDDFSGPKRSSKTAASSSEPQPQDSAAEEAFMKLLEADMLAQLMGGGGGGGGPSGNKGKGPAKPPAPASNTGTKTPGGSITKLIEMLQTMSEEDAAKFEEDMKKDGGMQNLFQNLLETTDGDGASSSASAASAGGESFPDTIQKTLERMQESGEKMTIEARTSQDKYIDASIARLMKIADDAADKGQNLDIEEVFNDVMKEMANKEMLYEPMKDYDAKYGPWLEENKSKLSAEDYANYEKQSGVIKRIVQKFETADYSDEKPECLAAVWDLMQEMEACGAPPEDLIKGSMGDGILPNLVPFLDHIPPSGNLDEIEPGPVPPECNQQ